MPFTTINSVSLKRGKKEKNQAKRNHGVRYGLMLEKGTQGGLLGAAVLCFLIEVPVIRGVFNL